MKDLVRIFEANKRIWRLGGFMEQCVCGKEIENKEKYDGYCKACFNFEETECVTCACGKSFDEYEEVEPGMCEQCVQERDEEIWKEREHPDEHSHEGKRLI